MNYSAVKDLFFLKKKEKKRKKFLQGAEVNYVIIFSLSWSRVQ
jgi:hypothetical protein